MANHSIECSGCSLVKPIKQFKKSKGNLCTDCAKEDSKRRYKERSAYHSENKKQRKDIVREAIFNYLSECCCIDCGENDPLVLEFDHIKGEKIMSISNMISRAFRWEVIYKEIEKCAVRCANCHRRKTLKESGSYRLTYQKKDVTLE